MTGQSPQKIRSSQALAEKLVESYPDAVVVTDEQGRIAEVNPQVEKMFGYERAELLGLPVETLVPERLRTAHSTHRKSYSAEPSVRAMGTGLDLHGRRKDGTEFPVDVMLSPLQSEGETLFLAVVRDISYRRKIESKLHRSEEHFRALFEFSPDAILATDEKGEITETNSQVEKFFGYTRDELIGKPVETLIPERFRSTHPTRRKEYGAQARTRPMGIGLDLHARRKDGSEFPVDIMLSTVETATGKIVLSVIRDLSEKVRIQEELERRERERRYLEEELNTEHMFEDIIGESTVLRKVLKQVETVAATDVTVLILGETGTGKDLIARAIHQLSSRRARTLVKLNCAAIPTGLLESELFGHEKGAFTGAISQKIGRLELAHQGTLFLDEIGDLPAELQPKILRALQEKEFERLGGTRTIPVDVRLVAATNRNLEKMVADREFRSDLYYRLRVFPITMPALRERREDIPLLVRYFVTKHARRMDKQIESIPPDVMKALTKWDWPGNIRELENFIERAVILTKGPNLRPPLAELEVPEETMAKEDATLEASDREHILHVLRETKGVIAGPAGAAARLGLKRTTLNSKLKKLGIKRSDYM
ncbi:MAG: sigma 54-interacting transcriptional regulator [Candidatus Acidiferrales bacterium]